MPEQGEFQAWTRPLPAGPCLSGHFIQRAAENGGGLPRGQDQQAAALEPTGATTSSTQGTGQLPGHRKAHDRPCSPGARRPTPQALPHGHSSPSWKEQHGAQSVIARDRPWETHPAHSRNCASFAVGQALAREEAWCAEHTGPRPPA